MIIYFADRQLNVLATASTNLPKGLRIRDDTLTRRVTGGDSFECSLDPGDKTLKELENIVYPCNTILLQDGDDTLIFSILETEYDSDTGEMTLYAESGGLDLLNDIVGDYTGTSATIETYLTEFLTDTGWSIGTNDVSTETASITYEGEETVIKRIYDVAEHFGAEISFSYEMSGMEVTARYVNVLSRIGKDVDGYLRAGREIDHITVKRSAANLATAVLPSSDSVSLSGLTYDDDDMYVSGSILYSRNALSTWARANGSHILMTYDSDMTTQATLLTEAIKVLTEASALETTYDIELAELPDGIGIGDTIHLIDEADGIYLSARITELETSETTGTRKATLSDIEEEE